MTDIEAKIKQLRDELNRHNYNYYVLNQPTIGDMEFDFKMHELEDLEKAHPEFADPLSPTQRVGSDISQGFKQVLHERPMQSLGNSYSIEEVQDFLRRAKDVLGGEPVQIVGEMKYDGTSISCTYEHGRLVRAVTRGDGVRGDDVTQTVDGLAERVHDTAEHGVPDGDVHDAPGGAALVTLLDGVDVAEQNGANLILV